MCIQASASSDCEVIGSTDEKGQITLPSSFTSGLVKAKIKAGHSKDQDVVGVSGYSYEMAAQINADSNHVITPFTTLDYLQKNKSLAQIAAELNFNVSDINGDYVAADDSTSVEVHALARSLTTLLAQDIEQNDATKLTENATNIVNYIRNELVNKGEDISKVKVKLNGDKLSAQPIVQSLEDYLKGDLMMFSTNYIYFAKEGIQKLNFNNGQVSVDGRSPESYTIDGDILQLAQGGRDKFLYVSSQFGLQVPLKGKDLIVTYPPESTNLARFDKSEFIGKTMYFLNDDSFCEGSCTSEVDPEPTLAEISFSETEISLDYDGVLAQAPWHISATGSLVLELTKLGNKRDLYFSKFAADDNVVALKDAGPGNAPSLMMYDKDLAEAVFLQWAKLQ